MKIYVHRDTGAVTNGIKSNTAIARIEADRLTTKTLELIFHDGEQGVALAGGSTGVAVVKPRGTPNETFTLFSAAWTPPATVTSGYVFSLLVASAALSTALADQKQVTQTIQFIWTEGGVRRSTPPIDFLIRQTYWQGTEEVPVPDPPFPLPGEILTTAGNLAGLGDTDEALVNLGLGTMGLKREVALPAGLDADAPTDFALSGAVGDWARDAARGRLWLYLGDGETTHAWGYTQLILA